VIHDVVLNYYKAPPKVSRNLDDDFGSNEGAPGPLRDV